MWELIENFTVFNNITVICDICVAGIFVFLSSSSLGQHCPYSSDGAGKLLIVSSELLWARGQMIGSGSEEASEFLGATWPLPSRPVLPMGVGDTGLRVYYRSDLV